MKNKIEFISYNGSYPCLCYGILKIKLNGKLYELECVLVSGGSYSFDKNMKSHIEQGPWSIDEEKLPIELKPYTKEIEKVVNVNVEYGCCGGCV